MPTDNDPLAEEEGPCVRCEGGWVQVRPEYAVHRFPDPTMEQLAGADDATRAAMWRTVECSRAAARNSVYPCRRCRPEAFYRWAGGHLDAGHDVLACSECIELMTPRRASRARRTPVTTTPRRDTDG